MQYCLTTISLVPVPASDARLDLVFVFYMGIIFARWKLHGIMRDWWSNKSFGKFITKLLFLGMYETNRAKHFVIQLVPPIQLCSTPLSDLWVFLIEQFLDGAAQYYVNRSSFIYPESCHGSASQARSIVAVLSFNVP